MKKLYLGILTLALLLGCSENNANSGDKPQPAVTTAAANNGQVQLSDDIIKDILQSIPSPLELSQLIKQIGTDYNRADLNDHGAVAKYNTNFKKALNLGVYGADLGYANIFGKNMDALNYLSSVKKLADGLSIGQFFDYNTLKRLAEDSKHLDSLVQVTTQNLEQINYHLREQDRDYLSILILTGGWVEATYLTTVAYNRSKNPKLREKIGEQKIVLDQLLLVLNVYEHKPDFASIITPMRELQKVYAQVSIETKYAEATVKEVNGELIIQDNNVTEIKITDKDIASITAQLKAIRATIIN